MLVKDGDKIVFGNYSLEVAETPRHTEGCVTYINKEAGCAFTGDTLLVRGGVQTLCTHLSGPGYSPSQITPLSTLHMITRARQHPPWGRRRS